MAIVFMFPGQNSRYPGMLAKFSALHPENGLLVEEASDILGRNLQRHFRADNEHAFTRNRDVQVGVFLASHMLLCSLQRAGVETAWSLGLSLGEYNHLVHIGALRLEDALPLLEARGDAYDETPHGVMASVFPIALDALQKAMAAASLPGVCCIALHNSPRQHVVSGEQDSIHRLVEELEEDFVEHAFIEERLAMHSSLMAPAAQSFRCALEKTDWMTPRSAYFPNVTAQLAWAPSREDFINLLTRHIQEPVLWRESLELIAATAPEPSLLEVGPKGVLSAMAGRRWLTCPVLKTDVEEDFQAHFEGLVEELKFGQRESAVAHSQR